MKRTEVFRWRISPEEQNRLGREADEKGLTKADLIRQALGWETKRAPSLAPSESIESLVGPPVEPEADPDEEPGKAALEELAGRIYGKQGVPMRVARQRAKEQIDSTT